MGKTTGAACSHLLRELGLAGLGRLRRGRRGRARRRGRRVHRGLLVGDLLEVHGLGLPRAERRDARLRVGRALERRDLRRSGSLGLDAAGFVFLGGRAAAGERFPARSSAGERLPARSSAGERFPARSSAGERFSTLARISAAVRRGARFSPRARAEGRPRRPLGRRGATSDGACCWSMAWCCWSCCCCSRAA